jgi:hypothetical protein
MAEQSQNKASLEYNIRAEIEKTVESIFTQKADYAYMPHIRVPRPEFASLYCAYLISQSVKRQEEINKAIKSDACWTKWLTCGVFILTAAVVALTIALLVKG